MSPITSIEIAFNLSSPMKLRLGDILILDSPLKAHNQRDISQFALLAILAVGFPGTKIYFTLLGLDALQYSISKHTKKGLVLLNRRGKEIEMSEGHIIRLFKEFGRRRNSDIIDGVPLYLRTLITSRSQLERSSGRKIGKRLINMVEWPDRSLTTWAKKHLRIPFQFVPHIDHIGSRREMIDTMIKLGTCQAKSEPESNKASTKDRLDLGNVAILNTDISVQVSWPDPEDPVPPPHRLLRDDFHHRYYYERDMVHHSRDDQGERSVLYRDPGGEFTSQPQNVIQSEATAGTAEILWGPDPATNEDDPNEIRQRRWVEL